MTSSASISIRLLRLLYVITDKPTSTVPWYLPLAIWQDINKMLTLFPPFIIYLLSLSLSLSQPHTHTYTHTHKQTNTNTYTHTHTHTEQTIMRSGNKLSKIPPHQLQTTSSQSVTYIIQRLGVCKNAIIQHEVPLKTRA